MKPRALVHTVLVTMVPLLRLPAAGPGAARLPGRHGFPRRLRGAESPRV
ncbi:hypothetical protein [Acrocarpospora macrocephala]|nr:hypothetical protein [Acrocarpospora macrocephala]